MSSHETLKIAAKRAGFPPPRPSLLIALAFETNLVKCFASLPAISLIYLPVSHLWDAQIAMKINKASALSRLVYRLRPFAEARSIVSPVPRPDSPHGFTHPAN
jgi:hypothetical protein